MKQTKILSYPDLSSTYVPDTAHTIASILQSNMAALSSTSRQREKPTGDEEAGIELKLGEFQSVPTLTLSEARVLINAVIDHRKQQGRKVMETE